MFGMHLSLVGMALAHTALANSMALNPSTTLSTLQSREVEKTEYPNVQINTYKSANCQNYVATNDAQYNAQVGTPGTQSYWISRDLSPGEIFKIFPACNNNASEVDMNQFEGKGTKKGCTNLGGTFGCYELDYTSAAPSAPTAGIVDEACSYKYQFMLDRFHVSGKNFDRSKMKADGSGLQNAIKGCGAIIDWRFEETQQDPTYQWTTSFNLPVDTSQCVGKALESAGGSGTGGCDGGG